MCVGGGCDLFTHVFTHAHSMSLQTTINTLMPGAINTPGCGPAGPVVCCHDSVCCQHAALHGHGLLHSTSCLLHSAVLLMAGVCSPTSPLQCGNDVTSLTLQLPVCILPQLPPTFKSSESAGGRDASAGQSRKRKDSK